MAKETSALNKKALTMRPRMGGHSRSRLRLEAAGKERWRIGCPSYGKACVSGRSCVNRVSLVNGRGREGARTGTIDLGRADGNIDWQTNGGVRVEIEGGQHESFVCSNDLNPSIPSLNTTLFHHLMASNITSVRTATSVKKVLASLLAIGLSGLGSTSTLQGTIKQVTKPDGSSSIDGDYWFSGKGNIFELTPATAKIGLNSTLILYFKAMPIAHAAPFQSLPSVCSVSIVFSPSPISCTQVSQVSHPPAGTPLRRSQP